MVSRRRSLRAAAARRGRGRGAHGPVEVGPELGVVLKVELRGAGDEGVHGDVVLEVLELLDAEGKVVLLEDLVAHADDHRRPYVEEEVEGTLLVRGRGRG